MNTKTKITLITLLTLTTLTTPTTQAWDPYWDPAYITQITANPPSPTQAGTNITLTAHTWSDTILDQETADGTYQIGLSPDYFGQTFVPQEDNVKEVLLWLKPSYNSPPLSYPVNATIWNGSRTDASSNQLGTTTLNITVGFFKIYTFRFPEPIPVTPGETYIIYVEGEVLIKGHYFHDSSSIDYYPPGDLIPKPGPNHGDFWFKTYALKEIEFSFSLDDKTTWTPWSQSNTYKWNTTLQDTGTHNIQARVKDITNNGIVTETWMPLEYTLTPPTIESIIQLIQEQIDHKGTANSLTTKLENIQKALDKGKTHTADNIINAYINQLEAQTGKHIPTELAQGLITVAQHWLN
jgi:FIMAH domain